MICIFVVMGERVGVERRCVMRAWCQMLFYILLVLEYSRNSKVLTNFDTAFYGEEKS